MGLGFRGLGFRGLGFFGFRVWGNGLEFRPWLVPPLGLCSVWLWALGTIQDGGCVTSVGWLAYNEGPRDSNTA